MATVNGTAGKDFIHRAGDGRIAPAGFNNVTGVTTGGDTINGLAGDDIIFGDNGNDVLNGGTGADQLNGGSGNDWASYATAAAGVTASLANPAVNAGEAAGDTYTSIERLRGSAFNDTLIGDANDNFLRGGAGADILNGGGGADYADYIGAASGIIASLANPATNTGEATGDTYTSIERLRGSNFNDTLIGDASNNVLRGGLGSDILNGGGGSDTASYADSTTGLTASLANPAINTGEAAGDTYISIEHLRGSDFNDILIGNANNNNLTGALGADLLNGGAGFDYAEYNNATSSITASLANPAINTGEAAGDTYISIEGLRGSDFNDTLIGDANNNNLRGGLGADVLNGGAGFDNAGYNNSSAGITVSLINPASNTGEAIGDTFISIEGLIGSAFNDTLIGDNNDNTLRADLGADTLNGMGGFDYASYSNSTTAVTASLATPAINTGEAAGDTYISIEALRGSDFNDTLIGDAHNNNLRGGLGADVLNGGAGFDNAGYNNSTIGLTVSLTNPAINTGEAVGDTFISIEGLIGSAFNDTLIGAADNNVLRGDLGADVLNGMAGFDYASYGNSTTAVRASLLNPAINNGEATGDTYISIEGLIGSKFNDILIGNAGDNYLRGGLGADVLNGGAGLDFASYRNSTAGLTASLANPAVNTGEAVGDTYFAIEGVAGSDFNDMLIGNAGGNILRGDLGADALNGGAGVDYASYSNAASGLRASLTNPAINTGEAVGDTYAAIEGLIGGDFNDILIGDAGVNYLRGGLGADALNGGAGFDYAEYTGAAAGVRADLAAPATNTGEAAGDTYAAVEGLRGSAFNDILAGNAVANRLDGGAGNDTLFGRGGADQFLYHATGNGADLIGDFSGQTAFAGGAGQGDRLVLDHLLHGAFAYRGAAAFTHTGNTEARAQGNNVFVDVDGNGVADFHITLNGLASANQLVAADFLVS